MNERPTPEVDAAAKRGSDLGLANEMFSGIWPLARRLERQRDELVESLSECRELLSWWQGNRGDSIHASIMERADAALANVKGGK